MLWFSSYVIVFEFSWRVKEKKNRRHYLLTDPCRMLWSLVSYDVRMKDRWHRHYEGKKKGSRFYSGEECMKPGLSLWSQCAHLKAISKTYIIWPQNLKIWQINLEKGLNIIIQDKCTKQKGEIHTFKKVMSSHWAS